MILFIKRIIWDYYQVSIKVVFGGSVNTNNISYLSVIKEIDGFIICSSILNPNNIPLMIDKISNM